MIVLGFDPGLRRFGFAVYRLEDHLDLVQLGVFSTEKSPAEDGVPSSVDNLGRGRELAFWLDGLLAEWKPKRVVVEAMSFVRMATVSHQLGIAWGVVGALSVKHDATVVQVRPQEIKKAMGVSWGRDAKARAHSKREVIERIRTRFPTADWPQRAALWEHCADAAAAVIAHQEKRCAR